VERKRKRYPTIWKFENQARQSLTPAICKPLENRSKHAKGCRGRRSFVLVSCPPHRGPLASTYSCLLCRCIHHIIYNLTNYWTVPHVDEPYHDRESLYFVTSSHRRRLPSTSLLHQRTRESPTYSSQPQHRSIVKHITHRTPQPTPLESSKHRPSALAVQPAGL
jgi:hypothetical protein